MLTFATKTFGCKLNQYETEKMARSLESVGYSRVLWDVVADLYLINSCTVTAKADRKARAAARAVLRRSPDAQLVMTGCYVELEPGIFSAMDDRIIVVDMKGKDDLAAELGISEGEQPVVTSIKTHTRLFLKIQDGCNRSCAYCRVVLARGKSVSRPVDVLCDELSEAVDGGIKGVVLTGVDLGSWLDEGKKLPYLLRRLLDLPGDYRIRLSSVDPVDFDDELIELLSDSSLRLCPHIHLPVQTGDDALAKKMLRPSRRKHTIRIVEQIIKYRPHFAFGADIMVGLPGEGEAEWENSVELVKETPFAYLHVFPYSPRPGTLAATMPDQIGQHIVQKRMSEMLRLRKAKIDEFAQLNSDSVREVLIEESTDKESGNIIGITDNYIHLILPHYDGPSNVFIDEVIGGERSIVKEDKQLLKLGDE